MAIQVKELYKDGSGEIRSILSRQFISFSYGGKSIEEFNLIATFSGDRLSKGIYAPFEDTTTQQEELDGQFYWRSKFGANELQFNLSTDGMTQNELDEFKIWFKPGVERQLILSENSNRAIMARVSTTPVISMLPFESEEEILIPVLDPQTKEKTKENKKVLTTMFKGDITLNFVMDSPYWESILSYSSEEKLDEDRLKVILEDGIPPVTMLYGESEVLLAKNQIFNTKDDKDYTCGNNTDGIILRDDDEIQKDSKLYYCGNAPEKPYLSFSMDININESTKKASFYKKEGSGDYFFIKVGSNELLFSLPSIMLAYNKVIDLIKSSNTILDFQKAVRDEVYDYYVRAYAITLSNKDKASMNTIKNSISDFFTTKKIIFKIDCAKGITKITTNVITYGEIEENAGNMIKSPYLTISGDRSIIENGEIKNYLEVTTNSTINEFTIYYKYKYL